MIYNDIVLDDTVSFRENIRYALKHNSQALDSYLKIVDACSPIEVANAAKELAKDGLAFFQSQKGNIEDFSRNALSHAIEGTVMTMTKCEKKRNSFFRHGLDDLLFSATKNIKFYKEKVEQFPTLVKNAISRCEIYGYSAKLFDAIIFMTIIEEKFGKTAITDDIVDLLDADEFIAFLSNKWTPCTAKYVDEIAEFWQDFVCGSSIDEIISKHPCLRTMIDDEHSTVFKISILSLDRYKQ